MSGDVCFCALVISCPLHRLTAPAVLMNNMGLAEVTFGTEVRYGCETGFGIASEQDRFQTCTANGSLSGAPPVCESKCLIKVKLLAKEVTLCS